MEDIKYLENFFYEKAKMRYRNAAASTIALSHIMLIRKAATLSKKGEQKQLFQGQCH